MVMSLVTLAAVQTSSCRLASWALRSSSSSRSLALSFSICSRNISLSYSDSLRSAVSLSLNSCSRPLQNETFRASLKHLQQMLRRAERPYLIFDSLRDSIVLWRSSTSLTSSRLRRSASSRSALALSLSWQAWSASTLKFRTSPQHYKIIHPGAS